MKKSNLITGILYVLFGVVCLIVALLIETKLEGILWGFAGAGIFPGIMMIWLSGYVLYDCLDECGKRLVLILLESRNTII